MRKHVALIASAFVVAAAALGCGNDDADDVTTDPVSDGEFTVEIVSPADGDTVDLPFTVEIDTNVELGPPESGLHHAHMFIDGAEGDFEIIDTTSWEVTADSPALAGVEAGERVLTVRLHTATHEPVGAEDGVSVTLSVGGEQGSDSGRDY
jgi:hypothetical protein